MIENARVKNAVSDVNGVTAAVNAYRDRYRATAGDDGPLATLQARGGSWANITAAGDGNGALVAAAASTFTGAAGEHVAFWQALKASGYISGDPADAAAAALPRNPFGGLTGIVNAAVMGNITIPAVCMSQVPGKAAVALDNQLDDGNPAAGTVRATTGAAGANTAPGAAAAAYVETGIYTVCRTI